MEKQIDSPLEKIETDNGEEAKKYYKKMYGDLGIEIQKKPMKILDNYDVSGDKIINVKMGDRNDVLGSIIDRKDKEAWIKPFEHYSLTILNYSILPQAGGMNNTKRYLGNDRFDTFIYALSKYYVGEDALILNSGAQRRDISKCKKLDNLLQGSGFETVYNFFAQIYGFSDPLLVNSMIKSGSKAIMTEKDLGNYLKLAVIFWNKRFDSMLDQNVIELSKSDKRIVYDHFNAMWAGIEKDLPGTDTTLKLF